MAMQRRRAKRAGVAIGLAVLCGCGAQAPIKVAFIGGLTGEVSQLAIEGRNGTELAIEVANTRGNQRYELVLHDEGRDPESGRHAIESAARDGDAFAVGPMSSTQAHALMDQSRASRLVLISPTANSDFLTGNDDYFFRTAPSAVSGAEQFAAAAIARGLRSAAVMIETANGDYTEGYAKAFGDRFESLGGHVIGATRYRTDQRPDYAALATQLLARHPRFVLLVCGPADAAIAAQQLRRLDGQATIAMSTWAVNAQLLQLGGRALDGALVLQGVDLDGRQPAYVEFQRRFTERYGAPPGAAAFYAYQATALGIEALRRKAPDQSLRDVLGRATAWPGLQQPVVLDRFGDSQGRFRLSELRGGRFVMLPS